MGSGMFFSAWSPRSSPLNPSLCRTWAHTGADMQTAPGSASRSRRAVMLILCLPLIRPIGSRRSPEVFVVEPTHAGHLHHPALARRLHTPCLGYVLGQR